MKVSSPIDGDSFRRQSGKGSSQHRDESVFQNIPRFKSLSIDSTGFSCFYSFVYHFLAYFSSTKHIRFN